MWFVRSWVRVCWRTIQAYGPLLEWQWQGKIEELGEKPLSVPSCPPKIPNKLTYTGIEPVPLRWEASDWPSEPWHSLNLWKSEEALIGQFKVEINGGNLFTSTKAFRTFIFSAAHSKQLLPRIWTPHHQPSFLHLLYVPTVQIHPVQNKIYKLNITAVYNQHLRVNCHVNEPGSPHWHSSVYALRHDLWMAKILRNMFRKNLHTVTHDALCEFSTAICTATDGGAGNVNAVMWPQFDLFRLQLPYLNSVCPLPLQCQ
jgi:hypothetical protein